MTAKLIDGNEISKLVRAERYSLPPCTPYGVMAMLDIPMEGKNAVIVGRSNIVGKPMALMLLHKNATISICTSKTRDDNQVSVASDLKTYYPIGF